MVTILSILTGILLGSCVVLHILYRGLGSEHKKLQIICDEVLGEYESLSQDLDNQVNTRNEEFLRHFQGSLSVGDIFHVPTHEFTDRFRGTTQKIVSINYEGGYFCSKPTSGEALPNGLTSWSVRFNHIPKMAWVKRNNNSIKHKFI